MDAAETSIGWGAIEARARLAAQRPYEGSPALPKNLASLNYDDFRLIAFDSQNAVWTREDRPFRLEFFHRGYLFADEVKMHLVEVGRTEPVRFDPRMFQYRGRLAELQVPGDIGFAGFRILGKFASAENFRELASFLGASYFRAVGEDHVYGTSARGLAIDVGLPKAEEFPRFREFRVARPEPGDDGLTFWALLDSPSVAGAYEFHLRHGAATQFDVRAKLFFRRTPEKIGIAPLTSMWAWGDGLAGPKNDPRPKVHDADGLLVHTADGEWIWRPLARLDYPSVSHYDFAGIRGFGLVQRDRRPESFRDSEAKYDRRPSVWIEPRGDWSSGAVELLELPGEHEGIDNIAAWWVPRDAIRPHEPVALEYAVTFLSGDPPEHALGRAVALRVDRPDDPSPTVTIDFAGGSLDRMAADRAVVADVGVQRGAVSNVHCARLATGERRVRFEVRPDADQPIELTCVLKHDGAPLTETWRYLCPSRTPK